METTSLLVKELEKRYAFVEEISEYEEEKLLEEAGFAQVLDRDKRNKRELKLLEKFGPMIRLADIAKVAKDYDLVFAHMSTFKGAPGPDTVRRIRELKRRNGGKKFKGEFFALAPKELFNYPALVDPVLFYSPSIRLHNGVRLLTKSDFKFYGTEDEGMGYSQNLLVLVDQWGGDLSKWRRLRGFVKWGLGDHFFYWIISSLAFCLMTMMIVIFRQ